MFPDSLRFVLFCLFVSVCAVLPGGETAEKSLHLVQAWNVNDNAILVALDDYFKQDDSEECSFNLPEEIDATAHWGGVVMTDGEELFPVIVLTMKDADFRLEDVDNENFRRRLLKNSWIDVHRYDREWKMLKRDNRLFLFTDLVHENRLDEIDIDSLLRPLRTEYTVALSMAHPENKLYPELPEEKADEPPFIKMVRENRKDEKTKNQTELTVMGLRWNHDATGTVEIVTLGEEGSKNREIPHDENHPFEVAGFYKLKDFSFVPKMFGETLAQPKKTEKNNASRKTKKKDKSEKDETKKDETPSMSRFQLPDYYVTGAHRFVPQISDGENESLFCFLLGTKIIPKEERKAPEFRRHQTLLSIISNTTLEDLKKGNTVESDWKDAHMIQRGRICVFYPKQPENLPPEDGQPGPEEVDEINRKVAETAFPIAEIASKFFGRLSIDFPIDIAIQIENGVIYFGVSLLSEKTLFDEHAMKSFWNYVEIFESIFDAAMQQTGDEMAKSDKDVFTNNIETDEFAEKIRDFRNAFGETVTEDGVSYTRVTIPSEEENEPGLTVILGFGKNFFCGAIPSGPHLSTPTMLNYIIFPNLQNRVAESRRLKEESPWKPRTNFQVQNGENWFRGEHREEGRKSVFSVTFPQHSLSALGILNSLPGLEYVKWFAPEIFPSVSLKP